MIIRILGEGQWEVPEDALGHLNELDARLVAAVESGDQTAFASAFSGLLDGVRERGEPLADEDLRGSEVILPPGDSTLDEVSGEFDAEGLIPD
ncbi:MAG TPA: hypothetical protein VGN69_05850 [Solirubrobacteraceae bacterium]|jgi:hypothetical protein|nr:hypothetical protein [Solirubrobacteraceae bacterium]